VRLPVDDRDLCARVAALQRLATRPPAPVLDEFDVLWRGDRWVALAPVEARILDALLARCGSVVGRRELGAAAWPDGVPGSRAVDARLRRLRDRVEPLGLRIHNVRRRGLLLELSELSA
jgi:DNA-binding response OmpR family regulator